MSRQICWHPSAYSLEVIPACYYITYIFFFNFLSKRCLITINKSLRREFFEKLWEWSLQIKNQETYNRCHKKRCGWWRGLLQSSAQKIVREKWILSYESRKGGFMLRLTCRSFSYVNENLILFTGQMFH